MRVCELDRYAQRRAKQEPSTLLETIVRVADDRCIGMLRSRNGERCIELLEFVIEDAHRGQGLGSAVLTLLAQRARQGKRYIEVSVRHLDRAKSLYLRHGFESIGHAGPYAVLAFNPEPEASSFPDSPSTIESHR